MFTLVANLHVEENHVSCETKVGHFSILTKHLWASLFAFQSHSFFLGPEMIVAPFRPLLDCRGTLVVKIVAKGLNLRLQNDD